MPAPYRLLHTLTKGHTNSVNCAAFCHDGDHLATGGDDSRLIIWNVKKGIAQYIIELNSPVLSVLWDSRWHSTLICGCEDGNAIVLNNFHLQQPGQAVLLGIHAPVYCLGLETFSGLLAIGVGPEVHIARQIATKRYATSTILPRPRMLTEPSEQLKLDSRVRPRGVHFLKKGTLLIVSYLNHGIICWDISTCTELWCISPIHSHRHIGGSALSPDERNILISNLSHGMDLYRVGMSKPLGTYRYAPDASRNVPLVVTFFQDGMGVMCGSHHGEIMLWDAQTEEHCQTLIHNDDLIQVVCAGQTRSGKTAYLATASALTGRQTSVKIWRAKPRVKISTAATKYIARFVRYYLAADVRDIWQKESVHFALTAGFLLALTVLAHHWEAAFQLSRIYTIHLSTTVTIFWDRGSAMATGWFTVLWAGLKGKLREALLDLLGDGLQ